MRPILGVLVCGAVIAVVALACGCAAPHGDQRHAVRLRFVPAPSAGADESSRNGASCSALVPLRDGSGVSRLIAHAGIGDSFPVKDEAGHCLFEVEVVRGDDDHLLIALNSIEPSQHVDLRRDKSVWVQIAGSKYNLAYPSVSVAAGKTSSPPAAR